MSGLTNTTIPSTIINPFDHHVMGLDRQRPVAQITVEILTLGLIWMLSILGNILVYVVIHRSRRMQSTTNYFVVSLAFADIVIAVCCVPFIVARITTNRWLVGSILCKLVRFIQYLVPCVNMYSLASICIDRFYTIIYPLSFKITRGTAKWLVAFSWTFASLLCCFNFYFFDVAQSPTRSNTYVCPTYIPVHAWTGIVYTLSVVIIHYTIPLIIIAVGYTRVFKHIWKAGFGPRPLQRTMNPVPRTKVKMVKMLMVVTYVTLLCYAPFYFVQLWFCFAPSSISDPTIFVFVAWLVISNGITKPFIYLCYNSNFRRGCKEVFCMSTMNCYRGNMYAITNSSSIAKKNHVGIMDTSDISDIGQPTIPTPSGAFNRAVLFERSMWPLSSSTNYM